jgi:zinc transport system permease protein
VFDAAFMRVALAASLAASVSLSVIGVYLMVRRTVFLGLVLANAATVGAAVGQVLAWSPEIAAVAAALLTALGLGLVPAPRRVSGESVTAWAYAAAASATVLILAGAAGADADTLHLLYGNVLAVSSSHATGLGILALAIVSVHVVLGPRFLLITFDAEAAQVAGVNTRLWSMCLNLSIGVAAAAAVHEVGTILTFSLLTLPPMASLLVTRRIRSTFLVSAAIGVIAVSAGLVVAFQMDLPPGPVSVALLAFAVVVALAGLTRSPLGRDEAPTGFRVLLESDDGDLRRLNR